MQLLTKCGGDEWWVVASLRCCRDGAGEGVESTYNRIGDGDKGAIPAREIFLSPNRVIQFLNSGRELRQLRRLFVCTKRSMICARRILQLGAAIFDSAVRRLYLSVPQACSEL